MAQTPKSSDPRREPIYRAILATLVASVLVGAALTLTGESLFGSRALASAGLGLAVVCGAAYWFFRLLARRRAAQAARPTESSGQDGASR
ncbi:MAG: hypothetical protein RH942_17915 [Kiloniellaceae bacterium]